MNKDLVKAEILSLSGSILVGKATEEDIKRVTKLALDAGLSDVLADEFRSVQLILMETK